LFHFGFVLDDVDLLRSILINTVDVKSLSDVSRIGFAYTFVSSYVSAGWPSSLMLPAGNRHCIEKQRRPERTRHSERLPFAAAPPPPPPPDPISGGKRPR